MSDTEQLLAEYTRNKSEAAFREIVSRYLNLVYSSALRMVGGDTHRAEDVAQIVFTALAKRAGELPPKVMLGGWLHRHTCFVASTAMRGERRRVVREREAMEMNLLEENATMDFAQLAPLLDETINQLDEADRIAIVSRFFEQRDFRAVGQQLESSEEAARKRVSRALEKLRDLFAQRGIRTTFGALSTVIAANSVQAAPIGLAAKISAAALSGAAAATTTIVATTKTIAMTTLQKIAVTAALAVTIGAGIYESTQAHNAQAEVQKLQAEQALMAGQIQQSQAERDQATNKLAALLAENSRLKTSNSKDELLKLRGQIGSLNRRLSESNTPVSAIATLMNNPAMKEYIHKAQADALRSRYEGLFEELKLTSDQRNTFVQLLGDYALKNSELLAAQQSTGQIDAQAIKSGEAELGSQLRNLLGDAGIERFKEYSAEIPAQTTVKLLSDQLGSDAQMNADQSQQLLQVIKAEPENLTHGISGELDLAFTGSQADIDNYLQQIAESNQRIMQQASNFLSPDQLSALNTVLTNGVNARINQARALVPKQ